MYTTVRGLPTDAPTDAPTESPAEHESSTPGLGAPAVRRRARVGRLVITLGTVSFFTDLSSEMVVAVLPVYLTLVLGLSPLQYGIVDGLYQGVTAAVRILGGMVADYTRRPKLVALFGYGLSCVCKLGFLPAHSFASISGLVALDRAGKGVRTAPRDAMIVASSEPRSLGFSFGVHRAMDTAGALGGPLIAFALLTWLTEGYDALFVVSFSLATVGVAVLVLFVPSRVGATDRPKGRFRTALGDFARLTRGLTYRRLLAVGALLSLATISDGFVYLSLKERADIGPALFPLLFVGTAAAYLVLAVPLGRLADRIGRIRVFVGGHVVAAIGYVALWLLPPGPWLVAGVLAAVGTYYAATDGVLPALTAPVVAEHVRTTGIAGVQTVMAVGSMVSATVFGAVWAGVGRQVAVACFAIALVLAIGLAVRLLRGVDESGPVVA